MRSRRTSQDKNHGSILEYLRKHGAEVIDLSGVGCLPDLLANYRGFGVFFEIKVEGSRATYTTTQLAFISSTRWPVAIVTNQEQALEILQAGGPVISQKQKDALAAFCRTATAAKYHPAAITRILDV